jgi:sugar phosphate isomerase/epimerase
MSGRASRARAALAVAASGFLLLGTATAVTSAADDGVRTAAKPTASQGECGKGKGRGIPDSQIGIQLWNFAAYVGFGSDPATQDLVREVLSRLREMGYRKVEPFTFNGFTATEYKALLDENGLRAPSRHGSTDEATWDQHLADAKVLGQKFTGSGGSAAPGVDTLEDTLTTAETLNRLGERSVKNGTGKIFVHNHQHEFRNQFEDPETGEMKSAWQFLVENTERRYVAFQLDLLWATDGGADPVQLLKQYGHRIKLLHVKDGINVADPANATPVPMGDGEMVFEPILRAAKGKVRFYIYEQDPPFGDPTFDPFASAQKGIDYLDCVKF